jgi:predicted amino acid racemase
VTTPRLAIDLGAIRHNAGVLVGRLAKKGIRVTGVTKAVLGSPGVAAAMVSAGVVGLGDSRVENLNRLQGAGFASPIAPLTLIRSPMLSQVDAVVRHADVSLNSEMKVLDALSVAAVHQRTTHGVILMVELGDLREGVAASEIVDLARSISRHPGLTLEGLGTNLACQSGVVPDQAKMAELSSLVEQVEAACSIHLSVVSGGNSANLEWALTTPDVGRVDELRLGEAILLGTDPLNPHPTDGLRGDAFTLVAEVIEAKTKPAQPWGATVATAFGEPLPRRGSGPVRQAILALGHQDVDPDGLIPPPGITILGASSDHLVVDVGDHDIGVGGEIGFGLDYSSLLRATTSPFVTKMEIGSRDHGPLVLDAGGFDRSVPSRTDLLAGAGG